MAPKQTASKAKNQDIRQMLILTSCLFSHDVIVGKDNSLTIYKIIDRINTAQVPVVLPKLVLAVEFRRANEVTPKQLRAMIDKCDLVVIAPDSKPEQLGGIDINFEDKDWDVHRLILEMPGFVFPAFGEYKFQVNTTLKGQSKPITLAEGILRCKHIDQKAKG